MSDWIVASQMEEGFNRSLRAHNAGVTVIDLPDSRPWEAAETADILIVRPSSAWSNNRDLSRPPIWPGRIKWVCSASAGIDFYPPWLLEAPLVTCARGISSEEIADYVLAAIYLQAKDLEAVRARSLDDWRYAPLGRVAGSTVGILGLGAIGTAVARRALVAGAQVTATRRRDLPSPVTGVALFDRVEDVVASADHLLLALPATDATRALVDARLLAHAKPSGHLINVARGSLLDQNALIEALDADRLGFATLDVTDPEPLPANHRLWAHPKVRLTPHVASNFAAVRDRLLAKIESDLDRFVRGEPLTDIVDRTAGY